MTESSFSINPDEFSREELWNAMGYRGTVPDERVREMSEHLIGDLVPAARMRYSYLLTEAERLSNRQVSFGGHIFSPGGIICSYLDGMTRACVFVATAGREFDGKLRQLAEEGDIVADYIADSIGTVLAELAVSRLESDLVRALGAGRQDSDGGPEVLDGNGQVPVIGHSLPYSPGYCGWDIREQHMLFSMFPPEPCGIKLSESSLMTPEKSISGFIALGENLRRQPYHCEICQNKKCYKRRNG